MTWGSPYGNGESGWGSPYGDGSPGWGAPYGVAASVVLPGACLSDEGGEVVELDGDWPADVVLKAYFRGGSGSVYPESGHGCYALQVGQGDEIFVLRGSRKLRFGSPPLPAGEYVIDIRDGGGQLVSTTSAVTVLRRDRAWPQRYELANSMPERWNAGNRNVQLEEAAVDANRPPYTPLTALVAAFGRALQRFTAPPCTRLSVDYARGDEALSVETPYRFVGARVVWVGGVKVAVTVDPDTYSMAIEGKGPLSELPENSLVVYANDAHPALFVEPTWRHPYRGTLQPQGFMPGGGSLEP